MSCIEYMMQKMIKWFYATNSHVKLLCYVLSGIGQKDHAQVVLIKNIEMQFNKFFTTMNLGQPGIFPRNIIQNPKNNGHRLTLRVEGGKQTIDLPM